MKYQILFWSPTSMRDGHLRMISPTTWHENDLSSTWNQATGVPLGSVLLPLLISQSVTGLCFLFTGIILPLLCIGHTTLSVLLSSDTQVWYGMYLFMSDKHQHLNLKPCQHRPVLSSMDSCVCLQDGKERGCDLGKPGFSFFHREHQWLGPVETASKVVAPNYIQPWADFSLSGWLGDGTYK